MDKSGDRAGAIGQLQSVIETAGPRGAALYARHARERLTALGWQQEAGSTSA
jgi:hypothetical protein